MRQELELSIAKESLDISTKLAIAEAKEGVLVSFEADGSLLSVSKSVKSVSPLVRGAVDNNAVTLEIKSAGKMTTSSALDPTTDTCTKSASVVCPSVSNTHPSGCMNSPSEEAKPLSFLRQSEGLTETHLLVGLSDQMPSESLLQNQTGVSGTRDNHDQSRGAPRPWSQSLPVDTPHISDSFVPESRQVSRHHQVQVGSDGNWSKRRQTETSTTETSTNRNVDKPKRQQTETSTNQNVDRPKRRQTKTSTDHNVDKPKRRQTKTSTNQNVDRPKRRQTCFI